MRYEPLPLDVDYIVREYSSGRTLQQIASELGVSHWTISDRLRKAGVKVVRRMPKTTRLRDRLPLPVSALVSRYNAGESCLALAKAYGVSRNAIEARLVTAGVKMRSQSEAEALKWQQMTPEQRTAQVAGAHRVPTVLSFEARCKHAQTVQDKALHVSEGEIILRRMLSDRGIDTIPQQAIGPYNCDLGANPVAVEIFGGDWHWSGRHLLRTPKRFRYILDSGWHILVIKVEAKRHPLTEATANYAATYIQRLCRDPSPRREYRVIRGAGELLAAGSSDDDEISIVQALRRGKNKRASNQR